MSQASPPYLITLAAEVKAFEIQILMVFSVLAEVCVPPALLKLLSRRFTDSYSMSSDHLFIFKKQSDHCITQDKSDLSEKKG